MRRGSRRARTTHLRGSAGDVVGAEPSPNPSRSPRSRNGADRRSSSGIAISDSTIGRATATPMRFSSRVSRWGGHGRVGFVSGSVWTRDASRALRVPKAIDTGIIWVNTMLSGYPQIPVPPHKMSGTGVELGMEGMLAYLKRKSIVINHNDAAPVGWGLG